MTVENGGWTWSWRKGGVMDGGAYHAFGLDDAGGPAVEEEPWASVRSAVYVMAREIYGMNVASSDGAIVLTGSVTSGRVKAAIADLFTPHAASVRDELEVASPFEPAGAGTSARTMTAKGHAEVVTRHPSITPTDTARPGEPFAFTVDLGPTSDPATQAAPLALEGLPAGWSEVRVDLEVFCDAIAFDNENGRLGTVTVLPDGASRPCTFRGRVRADAVGGATFKLMVTFEHGGRHVGSAVRPVTIEPSPGVRQQEGAIAAPMVFAGGVRLVKDAPAATLLVKIIETSDRKWTWSLKPVGSEGPFKTANWRDEVDLKGDPLEFARRLLRECPKLRPGRKPASVLQGIGEEIWTAAPSCFKELYAELRDRHGARFPIQIVTDEPHVPWEMMRPDAKAGIADADHLFMTHPVARWFCVAEGGMRDRLGRGLIASFVPTYADGDALPDARKEGQSLVDRYGAEARQPTCNGFLDLLRDGAPGKRVAVIHFAGHAAPPGEGGSAAKEGLRMEDDWVSHSEINSSVKLGESDFPFVVLNACSAGVAAQSLGVLGGWPASLARRGFGGILAPTWAVQDEHASSVVLDQLDGLMKGQTLGEAMVTARVCYRHASATPYAYLCYGDVMARMA